MIAIIAIVAIVAIALPHLLGFSPGRGEARGPSAWLRPEDRCGPWPGSGQFPY